MIRGSDFGQGDELTWYPTDILSQMSRNGGLSDLDLLSKSIALSPMREEHGIIRSAFFIDLGQNAFDIVVSCSSILVWDTWSRCVQMTAFALFLKPQATSSGRHLQPLPGISLKEIIGTISFESEETRRTRDSMGVRCQVHLLQHQERPYLREAFSDSLITH